MYEIRTYTYLGSDKKWHYIARRFELDDNGNIVGNPHGTYYSWEGYFDTEDEATIAAKKKYPDATNKVVELGSNNI